MVVTDTWVSMGDETEKAKRLKVNPIRAARGMLMMESASKTMEKYAEVNGENLDPVIKARVFRFLGRYADYKSQFKPLRY